jgi:predicted transcriptional regulator
VKKVISFLKNHKITYKIFKLPKLDITNREDLDVLLDYLKKVNNKFVRFTTINFDNARLESVFHKKYSEYLRDEGFEAESAKIFRYFSSKGVMLYLDKLEQIVVDHESVVPKTLACVIISQNSDIKFEDREKIPEELRKTIKTLAINYIKGVDNYVQMCSQILKIVDWFDRIEEIKFSLPSTAPIVLGNILKNFYQKVGSSIEVKTIYSKKTG